MDLWHVINKIFRFKLFCAIRPVESSKQTFRVSTRGKFLAQNWIYGCSSRFLIVWTRREKFRKRGTLSGHRRIMPESWYFQRTKIENSQVNPRRDFRFTLYRYRHLEPTNPVNFHKCSIRYIFKLISVIFGA